MFCAREWLQIEPFQAAVPTSNKTFAAWGEILGDEVMAELTDLLLHHFPHRLLPRQQLPPAPLCRLPADRET